MTPDPWTKACLTAIAGSLVVLAARPLIPVAHAADVIRCEIDGGHFTIDSFKDELKVEVESAFSAPGSSSSSPVYVEVKK